jgi:hypothetical protein
MNFTNVDMRYLVAEEKAKENKKRNKAFLALAFCVIAGIIVWSHLANLICSAGWFCM